jgi:hypothetical protein
MSNRNRHRDDRRHLTKKQRKRATRTVQHVSLRRWWQSPGAIGGGAAVVVVVIIAGFIVFGSQSATNNSAPSGFGTASASVLSALTKPNPTVVSSVGAGGQPGDLNRLNGTAILKSSDGRPQVIYVGADFCPYCAAERWSLVMALARFGTFSTLQQMQSSSTDVDPNTSTFTFHDTRYSSSIIDFQPTELEDRNRQPFESPSAQIAQIFNTVDQPPFTGAAQGFPFLDIAGRFTLGAPSYDPAVLKGLTWDQIASDLSDSSTPVAQAIVGNANYLTAAICITTNNQPASACSPPEIQSIEAKLNAQKPVG